MARKSGPSILQEELYPSGAERQRDASPREEMDDVRLIDLDVDEESPFLRAQKRVSARRTALPKKTANRLLWSIAAACVVCVLGLAGAGLYHYGQHSWRFRVDSSDDISVAGMHNVTKSQIMEVMGADIGRNIFFIPLAQQKTQLEQIPWVESASVMRFVPNRLAVMIRERTPVAFARVGPHMSLIDAGGVLMEFTPKHKYSFPVILGMNPGEPLSTRAPRMKAYMELIRQLDSGGAHYSQDLSEVDLSDLEDIKVRVNDPQGDVLLHMGSSDYLDRYKIYISHAQAWRQQFQKLESVDLRYDNQIIVNPDMERPGKFAPVALAVEKPASVWIKPAALLTRTVPHDRAVPKPAFELSQKNLESKRPPGAAKKGAVAKRKKVAERATRFTASAKRPTTVARSEAKSNANSAKGRPVVPALKGVPIKPSASEKEKLTGRAKPSPGTPKNTADSD